MAQLSLFYGCPVGSCPNPVDDPRWPCEECERALAGYIRPSGREVTIGQAVAELEASAATARAALTVADSWTGKAAAHA